MYKLGIKESQNKGRAIEALIDFCHSPFNSYKKNTNLI